MKAGKLILFFIFYLVSFFVFMSLLEEATTKKLSGMKKRLRITKRNTE